MIMPKDRPFAELEFGVLRARGADALRFLQGQLSNDVTRLQPGALQWNGYHNPQGRVIAVLLVTALAPDDVLAVLPGGLAAPVAARLRRFVLRARLKVSDDSQQWRVLGALEPAPDLPAGALALPHGRSRQLLLIPQSAPAAAKIATPGAADAHRDWLAQDIAEGLPQVYPATSEAFVAQMLNLDVIGAIAFDKGCYTGQEIIARAHYRGQVKRRMQRFVTADAAGLAPGESVKLPDGRACRIVEAVQRADGRCEFLGVAPLAIAAEADPEAAGAAVNATPLELPYALPL
jgi:tRNA-modifying protein YgfZ